MLIFGTGFNYEEYDNNMLHNCIEYTKKGVFVSNIAFVYSYIRYLLGG